VGGLSSIEAAGLASGSTQLGLAAEPAATSLLNLMRAVRGNGTPEGNKIMQRIGVNREDTIMALRQIGEAVERGDIARQEMEQFGGADAMKVMAALGDPNKRGVFFSAINNAVNAGQNPDSLVLGDQQNIFSGNPQLAFNQAMKVLETQIDSSKAQSTRAQEVAFTRKVLEQTLLEMEDKGEISAASRESALGWYDFWVAPGRDTKIAAGMALQSRSNYNWWTTLGGVLDPRWGLDEAEEEMKARIKAGPMGVIQESEANAADLLSTDGRQAVINNITNQYISGTSREEGDTGRRDQP
jgi:hypothetical protein